VCHRSGVRAVDLDPEIYKELITIFHGELEEQLEEFAQNLSLLTEEQDKMKINESIEILYRIAHTIKGSSQSVEIYNVGRIAENLEALFGEIKQEKLLISQEIIDDCFKAVDTIRASMNAFLEGNSEKVDIEPTVNRLLVLMGREQT
jgi:two-component system chemotaxis sensor kinase CheA